ncbi:hypothetical protein F5972_00655 [Microbispora cellulosiformans]|uniref:Integral membrane protein n=1 Tax=Microbispora cellulosiformans TaxID=2614688 RepID=A0A5J5K900_9ACTN|nr:hypothetical protein [Microbispora cellulosiformans]KAA9381396.1 hypothetical protein F5972_00655 [Microbispora cellulosiformans]
MTPLQLSQETQVIAGAVLLTIVTIEFGGWFLSKIVRGQVSFTPFQQAFARAGHAHAGVLVTLGLVCLLFVDATGLSGVPLWIARLGVPAAAALMSAGFFLSSLGRGTTRPNRLIILLWIGALCLAAGVLTLGVGLLTS